MAKQFPKHYWTLKFIGGALDGQERRYPFCPPRYASKGEEYRLIGRTEAKLEAEFIKCS